MLGRILKKRPKGSASEYNEAAEDERYKQKSEFLESLLGEQHDMVMHAIIPFAVGGGDLISTTTPTAYQVQP
jgi:hypothetical protein